MCGPQSYLHVASEVASNNKKKMSVRSLLFMMVSMCVSGGMFALRCTRQQSKIAWNSVVEEVVWKAMELEVARTMLDHDVRSCFQLLLYFLCVAPGQQSKMA